jgi:protocatechuate 3,4-dioxygenase beta subunit
MDLVMRRRAWLARVAPPAAALVLTIHAAAQVAPQTSPPQTSGTGIIIGQVVDGTTGAPVPEAIVNLSGPVSGARGASTPAWRVIADETGRFVFTDLPENNYWIEATMDGYKAGAYGQRRIDEQGRRVPLRAGERKIDVTLRVWKYAVIAGTVVDEAGEPVVGVAVRALVKRIVAGRPQYGTPYLVPSILTDDRGMFRLSRVEPGTYVIVAPSMHATVPVSVMKAMDAYTLRLTLFSAAVTESPPLGHHRTQQVGEFALVTMSTVLIPPPTSASRGLEVYRTTYYPAATNATEATAIAIGAGEERTDLSITLRPVPAVRVAGRLVGPDGSPPPPMALRLVGEATGDVTARPLPSGPGEVGFDAAAAVSDAAGRFMLIGVPPGEYELTHANQFLASESQGRSPYWLSQRVTVGTEDVSDLAVEVRSPLRVEGRIEFRGASGPQASPPLTISMTFESASGEPKQFFASTRAETPTFSTRAAGGRYILRAGAVMIGSTLDNPWVLQSVTLDGKDITDRAFDLQTDVTSLVITFSDRPSRLTGTVNDGRGAPSATAAVLVFPVDRARWTGYGSNPRTLQSEYTSEDGAFTFRHLPPGEYYAIAIDAGAAEHWQDPRILETLAVQATTLTVAAGEPPKTLNLIVRSIK